MFIYKHRNRLNPEILNTFYYVKYIFYIIIRNIYISLLYLTYTQIKSVYNGFI